jgi:hypothetical protein
MHKIKDVHLVWIYASNAYNSNNFHYPTCGYCRKKYEIATSEYGNPIKQDEKKGVLREVCILF